MNRYMDLSTLTEAVEGLHCEPDAEVPDHWRLLPQEHWFWQPLPSGYQVGLVDGEPSLILLTDDRSNDELRRDVLNMINAQADFALEPITLLYPKNEVASWSEQCSEASAWIADQTAPTLLIDTITGPLDDAQKSDFCHAILTKANEYKTTVGRVIAWRRACTAWVEAQDPKADHRMTVEQMHQAVGDVSTFKMGHLPISDGDPR